MMAWADTGREGVSSLAGMEPVGDLWRLLDTHEKCGMKSLQRRGWILSFQDIITLPALGEQQDCEPWGSEMSALI